MIPMGGWHDFQSETMPNHVQVFLNRSHTHIESLGQILPTVTMRVCGHKVEYLKDAGKTPGFMVWPAKTWRLVYFRHGAPFSKKTCMRSHDNAPVGNPAVPLIKKPWKIQRHHPWESTSIPQV